MLRCVLYSPQNSCQRSVNESIWRASRARPAPHSDGHLVTILLVDDHALVRAGLKRLLTSAMDVDVAEAADGHDALVQVKARRPTLVILDLNLPDLGGLELMRRIAELRGPPILVLSMHAEPLYIRRALDNGAAGYATKNI